MKRIITICVLFLIVILLVTFLPNLSNEYVKSGKIYISEIVSSNSSYLDDNNLSSDYIEIYNGYNYDINLYGYYLSDSEYKTNKWMIPDITIKSHEYLVIYASVLDTCNKSCHTNFKLSSKGEVVTLTDDSGNIISKVKYPSMDTDTSYSYVKGKYIITKPSPNAKNNEEVYKISNKTYNLKITEYMTDNKSSHYDLYGNYFSWVEIHNLDDEEVLIDNLYISDDKNNIRKCKLPSFKIEANGYKVIYFNKNNTFDGLYANFGLSTTDKNIVISNGKTIIDTVDIVLLKENVSYGIINNEWKYFLSSTPGYENNTSYVDSLGGNDGKH